MRRGRSGSGQVCQEDVTMRRVLRLCVVATVLLSSGIVAAPAGAHAAPTPGPCQDGTLPSGALSRICIPSTGWNGDLVVWAHGYVDATQPITFYHLDLPGGLYLPALVQSLGYAFATTSYRKNGLAVLEGVD